MAVSKASVVVTAVRSKGFHQCGLLRGPTLRDQQGANPCEKWSSDKVRKHKETIGDAVPCDLPHIVGKKYPLPDDDIAARDDLHVVTLEQTTGARKATDKTRKRPNA